jgi:inositol transport system substrate-binding protein
MKKLLMSVAVSALMCGAAHAANIGVAMVNTDNPFDQAMLAGIQAEAQKQGATLQIEVAEAELQRQINQVENFIASKVDAIVINIVDTDAAPKISQLARDAGIPLVYFNRQPDESAVTEGIGYVGSNELDSGTMQMKEACRIMGGKGNILVIMGDLANQAARVRTQDIKDVIATPECSGIQVLEEQTANWRRTEGMDLMTNWMSAGHQFDAVISNNDEMAIGAIQALKAAGTDMATVVVAGIDATPDGLSAMKGGDLDITVFQDGEGQGAGAVKYALEIAKGEKKGGEMQWIPFKLVTPENLSEFMK